ncbi:MAG: hypothetical protein ACPL4E_06570 [Thermoproteota archaeon]
MRNVSRFKWLALASLSAILVLTTLSLRASGEPQDQSPIRGKTTVSINAKGLAVWRTDEGTEKTDLVLSLTLNLGEKRENFIPIEAVEGSVAIGGTTYSVAEARGVVLCRRNIIVLKLGCDEGSASMVLHIRIRYFWMGGGLYALRGSGVSSFEDGRTIILFRGAARLS